MPLTITNQPTAPAEGAHIPCGGDLTLSVSASGVQPLSYQWIKDGKKLESSTCYQGCTSPDLHIKGNKGYLKGMYWCQVKNKYGSTLCSDETNVTVGKSHGININHLFFFVTLMVYTELIVGHVVTFA